MPKFQRIFLKWAGCQIEEGTKVIKHTVALPLIRLSQMWQAGV
jgi:hypothetical protein